jgi:hypothetical protein
MSPEREDNLRLGKRSDAINAEILFLVKIINIIEASIHILPKLHLAFGQGIDCCPIDFVTDTWICERDATYEPKTQQEKAAVPMEAWHRAAIDYIQLSGGWYRTGCNFWLLLDWRRELRAHRHFPSG